MRRSRTLFVTLVVFCLVLSSATASPGMWGWLHSDQSSEGLEMQEETLIAENVTSEKESASSDSISEPVAVVDEAGDEWVLVKKSDLDKAIGKFESAAGFTAKAKAAVAEAKEDINANAVAYSEPKARKMQYFGTVDAERGMEPGTLKLGLSMGFIFKDCLMVQAGVMKDANLANWMDKDEYTARVSLGIVF